MVLRKTLTSIVLGGIISLSGCSHYDLSQEEMDRLNEMSVEDWVQTSNNYLSVHQLLKDRNYDKAQIVLEEYLREKIKEGAEGKGMYKVTNNLSNAAAEIIGERINRQIDKIEIYLK